MFGFGRSARSFAMIAAQVGTLVLILCGAAAHAEVRTDVAATVPANADTVFEYVLVFPADADDQVLEAWRQRALHMAQATTTCLPQIVRFHVAASWQLPMLGIRCQQGHLSLDVADLPRSVGATESNAPVWLANTSANTVRGQVAAMLQ